MSKKRSYPVDIGDTSGAFRRAIQRKRIRANVSKRYGPVTLRNVGSRQSFPFRSNGTMPTTWVTTHRYVGTFSINPNVGVANTYTFAANGLYDPDITGTGHQPMGFDQMAAFYNHYEVIGAKIKFIPAPSAEGTAFNFGIRLDDSGAVITADREGILEGQNNVFKHWPGPYLQPRGGFEVMNSFSQKKFFGDKAGDRETWGDAASNPTDLAYFICYIAPLTTLQDIGSVPCTAVIEYITKWHEPKDFAMS